MNKFTKIAAGSVLALGLTGAGIGAANANTIPAPTPTSPSTSSGAHSTTNGTDTEVPDATEQSGKPDPAESSTSDGNDGGHQDQNGVDVQHDGGPNEK
ncbi:hypothetical protein [Humibacter sp.]|uniref:hypothetical protein n=1 Tax=Humibacter sp. TaxID=1940291 RepID=UPI003F7E8FC1